MQVNTPKGTIDVKKSIDPNYPGIWIRVNGEEVVLVEYSEDTDTHMVRVWDQEANDTGEDPVAVIPIEKKKE